MLINLSIICVCAAVLQNYLGVQLVLNHLYKYASCVNLLETCIIGF
jgi:hypothetical protein